MNYIKLFILYYGMMVFVCCTTKTYSKEDIVGTYVKKCEPTNYVERVTFTVDSVFYSQISSIFKSQWKGVWQKTNSMIYITYQQPLQAGGFEEAQYAFKIKDGVLYSVSETTFINIEGASEKEKQNYIECVDGSFVKEKK